MYRNIKVWILSVVLIASTNTLWSQDYSDSLANLYESYLKLLEDRQHVADSIYLLTQSISSVDGKIENLNATFLAVGSKLERISEDLNEGLQTVSRLTKDDLLTKDARLKTQKLKILATSEFVRTANNSFDAIDAALAQSDYLGDVGSLNSPTNTELGFSLSEEIGTLLQDKIIKNDKKFYGGKADKFLQVVKQIIENPVVTSVTNSVPALNSINAVVNLVSTISISEKKVTIDDYKEFTMELDKYIKHYEGLGKANYDFNSNIDKLKVKTDALREVLTNFTVERIKTVSPEAKLEPGMPLHEMISRYYAYRDLTGYLDQVINQYNKDGSFDYRNALNDSRLGFPFYATNQAQFIQQELETISNEYISTYLLYHKNILQVLENSKAISKHPEKIDLKIQELEDKLDNLVATFKKNVKVNEVVKNFQRIPNL